MTFEKPNLNMSDYNIVLCLRNCEASSIQFNDS